MLGAADLLPYLLRGAWITIKVTALTAALGLVLSFAVAFARGSTFGPIRWAAVVFVEVFRGTSAVVQLFVLFYVLPTYGLTLAPLPTAVVGLGLNISAYGSEIVRGALGTIGHDQREAARALGLSWLQSWFLVVLPQAFVVMLPSFGNLLIELLKATSLVSLITLTELTFSGRQMVVTTGRDFEIWTLVLVLYFAAAYPISLLTRLAERRAARFRA